MMLADVDDIEIDEHFFEEFASDLSSEDLDFQTSAGNSSQGKKRDFSAFLSPWEPPQGHAMQAGYGSTSPHTTESASECSGEDGSKADPSLKRAHRLEKNRASATRCRLKKKTEMNTLTARIGELMKTISQLTQENSALRADNASLTDHNRFLRSLISTKPELPLHVTPASAASDSQQAAGAASGIAILGIFGAFTMFSGSGSGLWTQSSAHVGRVLESPLQDLLQEHAGGQLHVFIVGVFLCLLLYATISYGAHHPTVEKKGLLPSHSKKAQATSSFSLFTSS